MSFSKFLDRLAWLSIVVAAIVAVGVSGILALVVGIDRVRTALIMGGALIVIIVVLWIHAARHRRMRRPPQPVDASIGQFSLSEAAWLRKPPKAPAQSPQLLWQPVETAAEDAIKDTRPMRRIEIEEPPFDPIHDTKPTPAAKPAPVYMYPTPGRGPYDDLFPPPQPGDEDYLEYDQETTEKVSTHPESQSLAPDEQPTSPVGPVTPTIEQPGARSDEPEQADQPDEPGEPSHSDPSDGESIVPPDNFPA